jgi:hypothetical protein
VLDSLQGYPEKSLIFFEKFSKENPTHSFKIDYHYESFNLIDLKCDNCECIIQVNFKTEKTSFAIDMDARSVLFDECLTCNEVMIKKLLE